MSLYVDEFSNQSDAVVLYLCVSRPVTGRGCWKHWSSSLRLVSEISTDSCSTKSERVASCHWRQPRRCYKWLTRDHFQSQTKKSTFALWSVYSGIVVSLCLHCGQCTMVLWSVYVCTVVSVHSHCGQCTVVSLCLYCGQCLCWLWIEWLIAIQCCFVHLFSLSVTVNWFIWSGVAGIFFICYASLVSALMLLIGWKESALPIK